MSITVPGVNISVRHGTYIATLQCSSEDCDKIREWLSHLQVTEKSVHRVSDFSPIPSVLIDIMRMVSA